MIGKFIDSKNRPENLTMHMANELLSVPVAAGSLVAAAGCLGIICRKAKEVVSSEKLALMGIMGAFIFAAQMVNFQLPMMPGTSGHMVGAVLLAIVLGPHAGAIVITSVVIVQCLIFQDGGLLALGCNIINMGLVPTYVGYFIYKIITAGQFSGLQTYIGALLACLIAIEAGAILVPIEAGLSGVLAVPLVTFMVTMVGGHFLVGLLEGLITVAVLGYIQQVRPDMVDGSLSGKIRLSKSAALATLAVFTIIIAGGLSLFASGLPDGLEWSYAERPDEPAFEAIVQETPAAKAVDDFQSRYSVLPDYSIRSASEEVSAGWTSFAGVAGSAVTMALVWVTARVLRRKRPVIKE
jgi:cobalt/nickel transport system permease protein